jgi:hypothetical protein
MQQPAAETLQAAMTLNQDTPTGCPYIKQDGSRCGRGMRPEFDRCAVHRPRGTPREFAACSSCGVPTRRVVDEKSLCAGPKCGRNAYLRERRAKIKANGITA